MPTQCATTGAMALARKGAKVFAMGVKDLGWKSSGTVVFRMLKEA